MNGLTFLLAEDIIATWVLPLLAFKGGVPGPITGPGLGNQLPTCKSLILYFRSRFEPCNHVASVFLIFPVKRIKDIAVIYHNFSASKKIFDKLPSQSFVHYTLT